MNSESVNRLVGALLEERLEERPERKVQYKGQVIYLDSEGDRWGWQVGGVGEGFNFDSYESALARAKAFIDRHGKWRHGFPGMKPPA